VTGLVRERNEDAYAVCARGTAFVVADGLGAHPDGDRASRIVVDEACRQLAGAGRDDSVPAYAATWERHLVDAIAAAHAALRTASHSLEAAPPFLAMGSTIVVLLIPAGGTSAYWSHVGDSRLYRLRDGRLELLTADHTRYGEPYRHASVIAVDLPHTNQLRQALGTQPELVAPVGSAALAVGDTFLLCSDGVSDMLDADEIRGLLARAAPVSVIGAQLRDAALDAGGRDNATLIVIRVAAE